MEGPLPQKNIDDIVVQQPTEQYGDSVVSHEHAQSCIDCLGLWMLEAVESLEADGVCGLVRSVGNLFLEAADGVSQILCECGSSNEPVDQLPEVLPHELPRMDMRHLVKVFKSHSDLLLPVFKAEGIESIIQQFSQFL